MTIAKLMAFLLYVALVLAALKESSALWASLTFTVAVVAVSMAFVRWIESRDRLAWAGFAAAGGACLAIWLWDVHPPGGPIKPPRLMVSWALIKYMSSINPRAAGGGIDYVEFTQICRSIEVVLLGLVGAMVGRLVASYREAR